MSADNTNFFVCEAGPYNGWKEEFYCISPWSWGDFGVASSLFLSIMGAAWYEINTTNQISLFNINNSVYGIGAYF